MPSLSYFLWQKICYKQEASLIQQKHFYDEVKLKETEFQDTRTDFIEIMLYATINKKKVL